MQQKVFRVEQLFATSRAVQPEAAKNRQPDAQLAASARELDAFRDTIKRSERELAALRNGAPLPRLQKELGAAVFGMEEATQKILKSAEAIDESARALSATLKNDYERGLAQEVQEHVVRIYEASNFQDLAGQRIDKAIATLQLIEQQLGRISEIWGGNGSQARASNASDGRLINGPKLAGDAGHADQSEVDRLFA